MSGLFSHVSCYYCRMVTWPPSTAPATAISTEVGLTVRQASKLSPGKRQQLPNSRYLPLQSGRSAPGHAPEFNPDRNLCTKFERIVVEWLLQA